MNDLDQRIREAFDKYEDAMRYQDFEAGFKAALPRWIPISERLPDDDSYVFVFIDHGDRGETDIMACDRFWSLNGVTHWMPLPQPPEQEGEDA